MVGSTDAKHAIPMMLNAIIANTDVISNMCCQKFKLSKKKASKKGMHPPAINTVADPNGFSACGMLAGIYINRFVNNVETLSLQKKKAYTMVMR